MQVNFNPSVNQARPQFKASFAKDKTTQTILKRWIEIDPEATLAMKLALEDSISSQKVKVKDGFELTMGWYKERVYELKTCDGKCYNYASRIPENWREFLNDICKNRENILIFAPRHSPEYYSQKAKEILETTIDKAVVDRRNFLKEQLAKINKELHSLDAEFLENAAKIAKKHIL